MAGALKQSRILTFIVAGVVKNVPEGANQIFLYNIGAANGKIKGIGKQAMGITPVPVTLPAMTQFGLDYNGKAYDGLEIDATGTTIEVVAIY